MIVSLHYSISESIVLRASLSLFTRPPCLGRGLLAHEVEFSLKFSNQKITVIPFLPKKGQGTTTRHSPKITLYNEKKKTSYPPWI